MTIKQTLKFGMWGLLAVLILAPLAAMLTPPQAPTEATTEATTADARTARYACRVFVERQAHDPGSVELIAPSTWRVTPPSQGSNVWAVHTEFRAKNRIGALGVARMTCYVELRSGDWHLRKFV